MDNTYNCPYCYKNTFAKSSDKQGFFKSWKDVRNHVSKCPSNTRDYIFSLVYGPMRLDTLQGKNFMQIRELYPLLEPSIKTNISKQLRKTGYTTNILWSFDTAKAAILNFVEVNSRIPTSRDTYNNYELPSDQWVKKHYSSWNDFIAICGLEPSLISGYGNCHKFHDGNTYRSSLELYFVSNFLYNKLTYIYEKPYPGNTNRISDFYLPDYGLYIEIAGGLRPEVIKEKIQFCIDNKLKLLVLYPKQIYKHNFNLLEHIKDSLLLKEGLSI